MRNKKTLVYLSILFIAVMLTACNNPLFTFPTCLHATLEGMRTFCEALGGDPHFIGGGIEEAFGVDYDDLSCKNCHDPNNPDAESCDKCHTDLVTYRDEIGNETCLGCHSRQSKEAELEVTDVHYSIDEPKENCVACHSCREICGDGTPYQSMWDEGARDANCLKSGCHVEADLSTANHTTHKDTLDCSACHLQTVVTCYNCHFDTFVNSDVKKAKGALKDWVFLVNDENGKVRAGNFQTLTYQDESFVVFAPFHSHSVTKDARACSECHNNEAIQELKANNKIVVASWDEGTSTLTQKKGVIPVVDGKMEFAYLNYDSTSDTWSLIGTTTDNTQYGYCTPLTDEQITKLELNLGSLKQYIVDNELMDAESLEKLKIE